MAGNQLLLINPPKKTGGKKMASRSKASRSAAAKKAAATRKRNAAKRSAAAKKAAATRKRNASKGKRKATRSTKASRSAAAKKAAATRKRNANKRKAAAKKAAATRKRNASKGKRKSTRSTTKRSTKASRSAAAKKAAATRKRNAKRKGRGSVKSKSRPTAAKRRAAARKAAATRKRNANKRSRAAKKAAATRRRNANKRKGSRKGRKGSRKARNVGVATQGKSLYDAFIKGTDMMVPGLLTVASVAVGLGIYRAVQNVAWDALNITGPNGYIMQAADMVPLITDNMAKDLGNFGNKALHVGSVGALGYLLSSKKALNLIDAKLTKSVTGVIGIVYTGMLLAELQTYSLGTVFRRLAVADFAGAINAFGSGDSPSMTYGLGMAHGNVGMMHGGHPPGMNGMYHVGGAHNMGSVVNKKFFGAHNGGMLLPQNVSAPTAATQNTAGMGKAFFGTRGRGLGSSRVNLF